MVRGRSTDRPAPNPRQYISGTDSRPEASMNTVSSLTGAQASVGYSWRAPSPPHIYVPQPREDQTLTLPAFVAMGYSDEERKILTEVTSHNTWINKAKEWKYSWRRNSQSILTFLQLGPSCAARDLQALKEDGVTMLLVIRSTMTAQASLLSGDKAAQTLGIESAAVDVAGTTELIAAIPGAIRMVNDHLISQYHRHMATSGSVPQPCGKVLVFCESGNERSAAFVVAYIMNIFGAELIPAIQYVQSQRFCVAFDDDLKNMLSSYQDILKAQRSFPDLPPSVQTKSKRRRDDIEDEEGDVDMLGQGEDEARFSGRKAFVPFQAVAE